MLRSSEGVAVGRFASERGPLDGIGWEPRSQPDETRLPAGPLAPQANQETSRDNQARRREEPMVRIYLPPAERANFRFLSGGAPSCRVPKLAVTARCALPDRRLRCRLHPQRRPWRHEVSAYQPASEQRATARPAARCPARRCVRAMKRSRAEQRGDNQVDRARVLEVRIHSPPADSPSLSRFRLRSWKSPGFAPVWRRRQAVRSAETRKVQQHRAEER